MSKIDTGGRTYTDTEMIDFLEAMLAEKNYTGKAILRWSSTDRGMRLHETAALESRDTIREAIIAAMIAEKRRLEKE